MKLSICFPNLKPGTAKTTCSVWLSFAFHLRGFPVLLADCDPAGSALSWNSATGFPFDVVGLATKDAGRRLSRIAREDAIVIADLPQVEDHAAFARSVMRVADEITVPVAPSPIEIERMGPIRDEVDALDELRPIPARLSVLLNRVVAGSRSGKDARESLRDDLGYDVLGPQIPRHEIYPQSYNAHPTIRPGDPFDSLVDTYLARAKEAA